MELPEYYVKAIRKNAEVLDMPGDEYLMRIIKHTLNKLFN